MSVHALSAVLGDGRRDGNPSKSASDGYARLVLIAIANRADDSGFCWPSIIDLAPAANVHRSTVNRNLDQLIRLGEIRMFKRGHYQSPAFAMTIVDHPLSTQEIVSRLAELDDRAEWRERLVDKTSGEVIEVNVPGQTTLNLGKRLSQSATISENHTSVSTESQPQASDQGLHPARGRENGSNEPTGEIVAERDNPGEIVAERDEIVADGNKIVAVARRSSEPSENRQRTARAAQSEIVAERDNLTSAVVTELRQRALLKARRKGAHNVEGLASKILTEDRDLLTAELLEEKTKTARAQAIANCLICDHQGFAWVDLEGHPVGHADQEAHTARMCDHQQREGEPPATDVRPVAQDGEGSPIGGAFHCLGCGEEAVLKIGDQPACFNCFATSLDEVKQK